MSQSHEPSYYEIALTNRQVLMVFVVLLVCVVVAFVSGVWVGRGGGSEAPGIEVAGAVAEEGPSEEAEATAVGELNFFAEKPDTSAREGGDLVESAEKPNAPTTLLEDVSRDQGPQETPREEPPAPRAEVEESRAEASAAELLASTGVTETASPPAPAQGEHVIQVFSSTDQQQARQLIQTLTSGGYPAFLSPVEVRGQTMYRVRIGPYADPKEAESVAERVRKSYRLDTWVTR